MLTSSEQQVTIPSTVKIKMFTHMKLQPKPRKTLLAHNLKRWEKEEKYVGKGIRDKQYYWFLYCYYYYYCFSYFEVVIFNCFLFYLSCVYVKSPFFELNFDPFCICYYYLIAHLLHSNMILYSHWTCLFSTRILFLIQKHKLLNLFN